jgi:hypothetical protein
VLLPIDEAPTDSQLLATRTATINAMAEEDVEGFLTLVADDVSSYAGTKKTLPGYLREIGPDVPRTFFSGDRGSLLLQARHAPTHLADVERRCRRF